MCAEREADVCVVKVRLMLYAKSKTDVCVVKVRLMFMYLR